MSLLDSMARRLGYAKAKAPDMPPLLQATGSGQQYTIPDPTVIENQASLYEKLSWIYGAVTAVANTAATAKLNVKRVQGEKLKDIPNHGLELRLMRPNPLDSRSEFIFKTIAYRALTGNCYWWLNRPNATTPPPEIWVLPPHQIEPIPDGRMFVRGYTYRPGMGERDRELEPWEITHFKSFHPRNWFVGLSPIEALATVAQGDLDAQRYNAAFFGKENAKVPGALAFADTVSEPAWEKLKRDIKENWGGTKRSGPLMLRGAGQGGVQWVAMSLSQKDMEFLASRAFTKEEIYSIYSPGLASVLAINATEANSRSGKATFIEMGVWPLLVSLAEKITNNLLPAYGEGLVAEFDDIRVSDRVLEMQEQDKFATVHTVNEIRQEYYDDKPLDKEDPRGEMFPAQIGPTTKGAPDEEAEQPGGDMAPLAPIDEAPEPETPPLEPLAEEPDMAGLDEAAVQAEANAVKEIGAWRRYALRHGATKSLSFVCEHVQSDVASVIRRRLQAATGAEEVKAAFCGPFLKMSPAAEDRLRKVLKRVFGDQLDEIMHLLGEPPNFDNLAPYWPKAQQGMLASVKPELEKIAAEALAETVATYSLGIDWALASLQAAQWASTYAYDLVKGVTETTQKVLQQKVSDYFQQPGRTTGDLMKDLEPYFGEARAESIAVTEVTRASTEGGKIAVAEARAAGQNMKPVFHTNEDELVCDVCGPLDGKEPDANEFPPLHPNCRCWVGYEWVR